MDAFVVVRLGGVPVLPYQIPWTKDGRMEGERSGRLAIENDRATEGRREIEQKAGISGGLVGGEVVIVAE